MPINRLISAIDDNRCQSMTIDNHTHLDDRLFIDYQYQSINWHRLSSNAIDSHRSSISSIGYALGILARDEINERSAGKPSDLRNGKMIHPTPSCITKYIYTGGAWLNLLLTAVKRSTQVHFNLPFVQQYTHPCDLCPTEISLWNSSSKAYFSVPNH